MLRITKPSPISGRTTIVIEGRLVGPWVEELRRAAAGGIAALDLAGVTWADDAGVALLRALRAGGTDLARCSGFLAALIAERVDG